MTNLTRPAKRVVKFYNGRGTAEQQIKEGKNALRWTRLSCHAFRHNAVRLQLHALAYNLANFLRTLALPEEVEHWSLTTLREKLVKIGARIVRHGRYVVFQLAEVAVPRALFAEILRRIERGSAKAAAALGMSIESDERRQPDRRGVSMIDGEPLQGAPKRRSRAQWESRVKCELLHTGRPPNSDILALCRTEPYGESRLRLEPRATC